MNPAIMLMGRVSFVKRSFSGTKKGWGSTYKMRRGTFMGSGLFEGGRWYHSYPTSFDFGGYDFFFSKWLYYRGVNE